MASYSLKEEDYNKMKGKFSKSTCRKLSKYVQRVLLDKVITVNQSNQPLNDFMTEMIKRRNESNGIGNNFNQSVKKLHTLSQLSEFKSRLHLNENNQKILLEKVEEIKSKIQSSFKQMVVVIHNSSSLRNALHYNENKMKQGVAKFIHAGNYPKDTELLGFSDKINRLEKQTALNQQTKVNSVHISLNFDSADKLSTEKFKQIVDTYMQEIGFGEQPFLVYEHNDAGHPHIHVVTTNIETTENGFPFTI